MKFQPSANVAILLATMAYAAPHLPPLPAARLVARDSINECNGTTWVDATTGGSPSVSDCQTMAANIAGGGSWEVYDNDMGQRQLVQYNTCAFGAQQDGDGAIVLVGNQDIIDLVNGAIDQFQWNGLVGASGDMPCNIVGASQASVTWGLYHS